MTGKEFIEFGKVIEFDLVPRIFGYIVDCGLIHPPIEFGPRYNFGAPYGSFERKSRRKRLILWKLRIIYWKFGIFEGAPEAHLIIYWKIRIFGVPPKAHLLILRNFATEGTFTYINGISPPKAIFGKFIEQTLSN